MKRPSFQFYPGDWLRATELRSCSVGARGLWMDMICLMHEGTPYGHLKVMKKVIDEVNLARMVGSTIDEAIAWITELEEAGVFSRTDDGCIFSRRMVRDEQARAARAAGGKEGGNPKLVGEYNKAGFIYVARRSSDGAVKIGISLHPAKRLYKVRQQFPEDEITLIDRALVPDMGKAEAALHSRFADAKSGEWFSLSGAQERELEKALVHLKEKSKEKSKENPTPASASASASASQRIPSPDGEGGGLSPPDCPHEAIRDLYHEILPTLPRCLELNNERRGLMRARWRFVWDRLVKQQKAADRDAILVGFRTYFEHVSRSAFLTGQAEAQPGKPPFVADLEWLMRPGNWAKVREGRYHREAA